MSTGKCLTHYNKYILGHQAWSILGPITRTCTGQSAYTSLLLLPPLSSVRRMIRNAQPTQDVITVGLNRLVYLEQCLPGPLLTARPL